LWILLGNARDVVAFIDNAEVQFFRVVASVRDVNDKKKPDHWRAARVPPFSVEPAFKRFV
jgi:hypothetical protein